jgi:hypothetical protein
VVFNADTVARTRTTVTVQATGLGGALAARLEGDARPAYVGPTLARLAAGGDDPVVTDAPVNAQLRTAGGAAALARRAGAARAAYAARRAGDAP